MSVLLPRFLGKITFYWHLIIICFLSDLMSPRIAAISFKSIKDYIIISIIIIIIIMSNEHLQFCWVFFLSSGFQITLWSIILTKSSSSLSESSVDFLFLFNRFVRRFACFTTTQNNFSGFFVCFCFIQLINIFFVGMH